MSEQSLIEKARHAFEEQFHHAPEWTVRAPGRVNLIGEHVDYNGGPVLPLAIELQVIITAAPNSDGVARLQSEGWPEVVEIPLNVPMEKSEPAWGNYVRGVIAGFQRRGVTIPGFDAYIVSDLPHGCGLSSSAALEVATATLIEAMTGASLSLKEKALLCQKAEHEFAGVPCGIMDQFASTFGKADHAVLIDCQSQEVTPIPLPASDVAFLIIDTRVKHSLGDSAYAERRRTCEAAASMLGVTTLREYPVSRLDEAESKLDPISFRRTRHIVTEIARTFEAVEHLRSGAWSELGALMYASHNSLRDDYEVSCLELDEIVRIARGIEEAGGVFGCRMTGGGFGGSAIAIVKQASLAEVQARIQSEYRLPKGISFISTRAADGAGLV